MAELYTLIQYYVTLAYYIISDPPKIIRPPLSQAVAESDTVTFECKYSGSLFPITSVAWKKDNELIDVSSNCSKINHLYVAIILFLWYHFHFV